MRQQPAICCCERQPRSPPANRGSTTTGRRRRKTSRAHDARETSPVSGAPADKRDQPLVVTRRRPWVERDPEALPCLSGPPLHLGLHEGEALLGDVTWKIRRRPDRRREVPAVTEVLIYAHQGVPLAAHLADWVRVGPLQGSRCGHRRAELVCSARERAAWIREDLVRLPIWSRLAEHDGREPLRAGHDVVQQLAKAPLGAGSTVLERLDRNEHHEARELRTCHIEVL